jgi:hypothetical protein
MFPRQQNHVTTVTDMHATIEKLLEEVFSLGSVQRLYQEGLHSRPCTPVWRRVRITVTLRAVGGDEKESLKSETVKYGHESQGTRTRERLRWRGLAASTKERPVLSSERAPRKRRP